MPPVSSRPTLSPSPPPARVLRDGRPPRCRPIFAHIPSCCLFLLLFEVIASLADVSAVTPFQISALSQKAPRLVQLASFPCFYLNTKFATAFASLLCNLPRADAYLVDFFKCILNRRSIFMVDRSWVVMGHG